MSTNNNQQSLSEGSKEEANFVSEEEFMETLEETGHLIDFLFKSKNSDKLLHLLLIKEMVSFGDILTLNAFVTEIFDAVLGNEE